MNTDMNFCQQPGTSAGRLAPGRTFCALGQEHLELLKHWRNAQMDVLRQSRPLTDADQQAWLQSLAKDARQVLFAMHLPADSQGAAGEFIGYGGLTNLDAGHRRAEISFLVNPVRAADLAVYREDFLAALAKFCDHGFSQLHLNRIFTETFDFRAEHMQVLEEFGFRREGVLRQHVFKRGRFHDSILHSMLASEWTARAANRGRE